MRYSGDHKAATRRKIVEAAGRVFRERGRAGAGVDAIMQAAGLTAGGFYAHFSSKEELFTEMFLTALEQGRVIRGAQAGDETGPARLQSIARTYLSSGHRQAVTDGCPLPPLLAELPRHNDDARTGFTSSLKKLAGELAPHLSPEKDPDPARIYALLALMVGGLSLSRAVNDDALAEDILAACRALAEHA